MSFRQICGNGQWQTSIWCSHNVCGNNCSHKFVGTANRGSIFCSRNPCGNSAVPTKLAGTPCGSFFLVMKGDIRNKKIRLPPLEGRIPVINHHIVDLPLNALIFYWNTNMPFRQICGNSCSQKLFRQALWEQALFPQICRNGILCIIPRPERPVLRDSWC